MTAQKDAAIESGTTVLIPLNRLKKSPRNARTTPHPEAAIEALAASIHAKGLLQNLVVEPEHDAEGKETGYYFVTAGEGRRLAQLLRAKRRQIRKSEPIRCFVDATGDPLEVSLDENVTRTEMHPADQFDAFRRLGEEQGWGAEEIAARFGVTANVVRQRLRLAAVSPRLVQRYREGELTLDQLMAFAISEDHARQEQVYENLGLGWSREPRTIRRLMMESHVDASDRRAVFVGLDAYEAAGGAVVRDLLSEEGGGYLEDAALLDRLALEKLAAVAAEVRAEGWKWAEAYLDFPHDHGLRRAYPRRVELPEEERERLAALEVEYDELAERYESDEDASEDLEARLEALEAEIERLSDLEYAFDPEVVARGGVFVSLDRDGTPRIERGFLRRGDEPAAEPDAPGTRGGQDGHGTPAYAGGSAPAGDNEDADAAKPLSDALIRDLTAYRTLGLRLALGERPDMALVAATHALAAQTFYPFSDAVTCLEFRSTQTSLGGYADGIEETDGARALAERHETWAVQLPHDAAELWGFVAALDQERRLSLFAHCVALTVFAIRQRWDGERRALAIADRIAEAVSLDMTAHWAPTVRSYLGRVTKAQILEAVREGVSGAEAERIAGMKKQPMAEAAERLLAGTGWLPAPLRTVAAGDADAEGSPASAA